MKLNEKAPEETTLNAEELGEVLVISSRRVREFAREKRIPSTIVSRGYRFVLWEGVAGYCHAMLETIRRHTPPKRSNAYASKPEAEARLKNSQAARAEIKFKEVRENVIPTEDVEAMTTELITT